jgi:uncharacterized phage protein (TIGR01671 family)
MRDYKFRALEKLDNTVKRIYPDTKPKMVYGTGLFKDGVNTWLLSHEEGFPLASGVCGEIGERLHSEKHIVDEITIGQYTGLKDKNGKEIYEGDVLKDLGHDRYYWITSFNNGSFIGIQSNCQTWNVNLYTLCKYPLEIIGNIYENPELLQEESHE